MFNVRKSAKSPHPPRMRVITTANKRAAHVRLGALGDFIRRGVANAGHDADNPMAQALGTRLAETLTAIETSINASEGLCKFSGAISSDGAISVTATPLTHNERPAKALLDKASIGKQHLSKDAEAFYKKAVIHGVKGLALGMTEDEIYRLPPGKTVETLTDDERLEAYSKNVKGKQALKRVAAEFNETETDFVNDMRMLTAALKNIEDKIGENPTPAMKSILDETRRWRRGSGSIAESGEVLFAGMEEPAAGNPEKFDSRRNLRLTVRDSGGLLESCEKSEFAGYLASVGELLAGYDRLNKMLNDPEKAAQLEKLLVETSAQIENPARSLANLIIKPVQRLPRIRMLLAEMIKLNPEPEQKRLQEVLKKVEAETSFSNTVIAVEQINSTAILDLRNSIEKSLPPRYFPQHRKADGVAKKLFANLETQASLIDKIAYARDVILPVLQNNQNSRHNRKLVKLTKDWVSKYSTPAVILDELCSSYSNLKDDLNNSALRDRIGKLELAQRISDAGIQLPSKLIADFIKDISSLQSLPGTPAKFAEDFLNKPAYQAMAGPEKSAAKGLLVKVLDKFNVESSAIVHAFLPMESGAHGPSMLPTLGGLDADAIAIRQQQIALEKSLFPGTKHANRLSELSRPSLTVEDKKAALLKCFNDNKNKSRGDMIKAIKDHIKQDTGNLNIQFTATEHTSPAERKGFAMLNSVVSQLKNQHAADARLGEQAIFVSDGKETLLSHLEQYESRIHQAAIAQRDPGTKHRDRQFDGLKSLLQEIRHDNKLGDREKRLLCSAAIKEAKLIVREDAKRHLEHHKMIDPAGSGLPNDSALMKLADQIEAGSVSAEAIELAKLEARFMKKGSTSERFAGNLLQYANSLSSVQEIEHKAASSLSRKRPANDDRFTSAENKRPHNISAHSERHTGNKRKGVEVMEHDAPKHQRH